MRVVIETERRNIEVDVRWMHICDNQKPRVTICNLNLVQKAGGHHEYMTHLARGKATVSLKDQFRKNVGRKISLARAMLSAGLDKVERTRVWKAYDELTGKLSVL